jgi:DNA-binding HxlR family transcriptional regulator
MNKIAPIAAEACGLDRALRVIAGKWKPTIIWTLHVAPLRFGELRRAVSGISEKILFEQLRELERDGVVQRREFAEKVARVEYSLTPQGALLNSAVHAVAEWGTEYGAPVQPSVAAE